MGHCTSTSFGYKHIDIRVVCISEFNVVQTITARVEWRATAVGLYLQ